MKKTPIQELENDALRAVFFEDASAEIEDKATGTRWQMLPTTWQDRSTIIEPVVWTRRERVWADYYIARFTVRKSGNGDHLEVTMRKPPHRESDVSGTFRVRWSLEGRSLALEVFDIDDRLPSLNFPPAIVSDSLIMPSDVGLCLKTRDDGMNAFFSTQNNGLNQRWVGGLAPDEKSGWLMRFESGYEDIGVYRNNTAIMPCYLLCKGAWEESRSIRYCFVSNGYVEMAKIMRRYLEDLGVLRYLPEKIEATPGLKNLLGGRIVSAMQAWTEHRANAESFLQPAELEEDRLHVQVTHREMAEAMRLAKDWGMERGVFTLRGAYAGGYDERHPDIWPPEPALGSLEELKGLFQHENDNYLTVLHDNYQDIYPQSPSFPEGVIQTSEGELLRGGFWHGGQTYILCATQQPGYARRNWPLQHDALGMRAHFIDTCTCVAFYECYHPDYPATRADERKAKIELISFFKEQGIILGSEEAADFGLAYLDWLENRHIHTPGGHTPPLWGLAFHDAAFYARYPSEGTSGGNSATGPADWLWGYMAYYPVNSLEDWKTREAEFKAGLPLDAFHARVGMDEMRDHRFLDSDKMVEFTEFSSGVGVYANFSDEPREIEGRTIPAEGVVVVD